MRIKNNPYFNFIFLNSYFLHISYFFRQNKKLQTNFHQKISNLQVFERVYFLY